MRSVVLAVAAVATTACLESRSVTCGDHVCPPGAVCAALAGGTRCVRPDQVEACRGHGEGDACSISGVPDGRCSSGVCVAAGCGDGLVEPDLGEVCDDGNRDPGDGCNVQCTSDETCGNGVVD